MAVNEYHINLSRWFRQYIQDLTYDIPDSKLWEKHEFINNPGWTLIHLIVECELALKKLKPEYEMSIENFQDFMYGSDGSAILEMTANEMLDKFDNVYNALEVEVTNQINELHQKEISDESLKGVLKTELDFYLHMLTTHIAMHCDALTKWRLAAGMKLPYA